MADETFYGSFVGVTLTAENNKVEWDLLANDEEYPRGQKLIIKQVLLGADAKPDEFNVVEVQIAKDSLKIPIAVLKAGETRAVYPDSEFFDTSVTFKLVRGSGPVYLHGQNIKDDVVDMDDEETEEEEGPEEEDEGDVKPKAKKAKLENNTENKNSKPNKKK